MEVVAALFCKERIIYRNEDLTRAAREADSLSREAHQIASLQTRPLNRLAEARHGVRRQSAAATALSACMRSNKLGEILDCFR